MLVLMNRLGPYLARKTGRNALRQSYRWVVAVLAVDLVENTMEYLLVTTYMSSVFEQQQGVLPSWWSTAVKFSSLATSVKWLIVYLGVLYSVVLAVVAGGIAAGFTGQQPPAAVVAGVHQ